MFDYCQIYIMKALFQSNPICLKIAHEKIRDRPGELIQVSDLSNQTAWSQPDTYHQDIINLVFIHFPLMQRSG
jgi:hypothetical protein